MNHRRIHNRYQKYKINISDFKIIRQLGQGGYGSVFLVQSRSTGSQVAAKVISSSSDEANYKEMVNNEIKILIKLKHPTIVKFIGYSFKDFYDQENVTIFTEFARKGSLDKYLQNSRKRLADSFYDNTYRQILLVGIARGMMFLHQNNIIHRDIKPGNILLDENMHPLVADFGFSKSNSIYSMSQNTDCGTYAYRAPEIINGNNYTAKVDVYAFGILMYEIVTDSVPYPLLTRHEITPFKLEEKVVEEDYRPTFEFPVKESIQELIKKCWSKNPKERPTFENIFKKLAYGIENTNDNIFDDDDDDDEYNVQDNDKYYLDNVDVNAVVEYADTIASDFSAEEENEELKKKLDVAKKNELALNPLKIEMKKKIDGLQKENEELKKKLDVAKKNELALNPLKKEMTKKIDGLQKENEELKKKLHDEKKENLNIVERTEPMPVKMKPKKENLNIVERTEPMSVLMRPKKENLNIVERTEPMPVKMKPKIENLNIVERKEPMPVTMKPKKEIKSVFQMKIAEYAKIQTSLCNLKPDASDHDINELINSIPRVFLNQKDNLMMICQMFALFARTHHIKMKRLVIKLFERIMTPIKKLLKDESAFFWCIFGGLYYFKAWMYEEGLISVEQIILGVNGDQPSLIEYFLPEIMSSRPEIFNKELKFKYNKPYSRDSIRKTEEVRKKHFKWLRESADYNNILYREIEKDSLRLAIKLDDIESFKRIFSKSKLSIDSKIHDNIYDSVLKDIDVTDLLLINYAIIFNATKIFKFLLVNGADLSKAWTQLAVYSNNREFLQILKEKNIKNFHSDLLCYSICFWNSELINHALKNYDFDYLQKSEVSNQKDNYIRKIVHITFSWCNFSFFKEFLDPFFNKNAAFISRNIHSIVKSSFTDLTCLFTEEFIKNPNFNINYSFNDDGETLLNAAITENNDRAFEILISNPKLDINAPIFRDFPAIHCCCKTINLKIPKLLYNHRKINFSITNNKNIDALPLYLTKGCFYHAQILLKYCPHTKIPLAVISYQCLRNNHLYSLKVLLKHAKSRWNDFDPEKTKRAIRDLASTLERDKLLKEFQQLLKEI